MTTGRFTRRHFLQHGTLGVGSVALAWLLNRDRRSLITLGPRGRPRRPPRIDEQARPGDVLPGEELEVEKLPAEKSTSFEALLVIDGDKISLGKPAVTGVKVTADVLEQVVKALPSS